MHVVINETGVVDLFLRLKLVNLSLDDSLSRNLIFWKMDLQSTELFGRIFLLLIQVRIILG